ncbi:perlucin-like [Saccostrea cucullata]|uniref:perlucin-like n=1 Tax=Saccostrea cuccullata TaxID=36930 RepID=UPI002ED4C218
MRLAVKQCEGNAAYLAEIESREENDWISSLIRDYCVKDSPWCHTWIGARDIVHEGVFTWGRYGNQVTFTHWALGQPDNAGSVEHCVHLYADGLWNDMPCQVSISFVCEKNIELNNQSDGVIITREQV